MAGGRPGIDDAGVLAPGAAATYAVWDSDAELVVQTPDERVAAWSTDPRAGVPVLPDLSDRAGADLSCGRWSPAASCTTEELA